VRHALGYRSRFAEPPRPRRPRRFLDPWLAYYPIRLYFRAGDWLLFQWWWHSRPFMWALERRAIAAGLLTVEQAEAAVFGTDQLDVRNHSRGSPGVTR
jgi:hypothetical protein